MVHIIKSFKSPVSYLIGNVIGSNKQKIFNKLLTVFVFHDVTNKPSKFSYTNNLFISPDLFKYQIKFIKNNFNIISPINILNKELPDRAAFISFDDGFKSYFDVALPILEKNNVPSLIFLNMGPINGEIFWSGLLLYLTKYKSDFREHVKNR